MFLKSGRKIKKSHKEEIEPEEILLDSKKEERTKDTGFGEGALELPINNKVITLLFFVIILVLAALFLRTFYLSILKHDYYQNLSRENYTRVFSIKAFRGIIYDKDDRELVENIPFYDVFLDFRISEEKDASELELKLLSEVLEKPISEIKSFIQKKRSEGKSSFILAENISQAQYDILKGSIEYPLSAVRIEPTFRRNYLLSPYFSHILGYTGFVSEEDISQNSDYFLRDFIGKDGIEFYYDELLRGENGEEHFYVDAFGNSEGHVRVKNPLPGADLYLNIDADLQQKLYEILANSLKRNGFQKAVAIAVSPQDGKILALINLPGYDSNIFTKLDLTGEASKILQDPSQPLFNRAISGEYPSGSTIKPLIASAALEENIISPYKKLQAPAAIFVPNIYNPEIIYKYSDWKDHGFVNMIEAIAESANTYFYKIGGGYEDMQGLGIEKIQKYLKLFGLGRVLGIDLPGEFSGLIPSPEWKKSYKNEDWYTGDTYNISIGQGDISVTPLQMALAISVLANNGILYRPRILNKILDKDGHLLKEFKPEIIRKDFIAAKNIDVVRKGMREAVVSGSSRALADLPVKVAGKTGTAQVGGDKKSHAWWTGFAPYTNPEIVITILVENGGEGTSTAVPIAKEVLGWYFNNR